MFYSKLDIFSQSWLDIIFEGRNKQYGAYSHSKTYAVYSAKKPIIA